MDSFNGITLIITKDGVPRKTTADVSIRHMPGGAYTYIDIGGATLPRLDLACFFRLAVDALAFEAQLGNVGTLVCMDGTFTALLLSLSRTARGLSAAGETILTAEFVLL